MGIGIGTRILLQRFYNGFDGQRIGGFGSFSMHGLIPSAAPVDFIINKLYLRCLFQRAEALSTSTCADLGGLFFARNGGGDEVL